MNVAAAAAAPGVDVFQSFLRTRFSTDTNTVSSVLKAFCGENESLDKDGFQSFICELFRSPFGYYILDQSQLDQFHQLLGFGQELITMQEFSLLWRHWVSSILQPKNALLVINMQNDFIAGSCALKDISFSGQDASCIIPSVNKLLQMDFDLIIYSLEHHPERHVSFIEDLPENWASMQFSGDGEAGIGSRVRTDRGEVILWPRHCVRGSWGAQLADKMVIADRAVQVITGNHELEDTFSAFYEDSGNTESSLLDCLRLSRTTDLYLCGLLGDITVAETGRQAALHGLRTVLVTDATIGSNEPSVIQKKSELKSLGVSCVCSDQVADMLVARDRRPELGFVSAINFAQAIKRCSTQHKINQAKLPNTPSDTTDQLQS